MNVAKESEFANQDVAGRNKDVTDKSNIISDKSFLVRIGALVMLFCIIALLSGILLYGLTCISQRQEKMVVQFVIQTDSTGMVQPDTKRQVDSLVAVVNRHEHILQDKYEHILEQKEIFNDVLTIGGMFLAVVLSLFGFFGYKSINAIEENVKEQAEKIANSTAEASFKERFDEFKKQTKVELKDHIKPEVREQLDKHLAEKNKALRQSVDDKVKKAVINYSDQLDEQKRIISDLSKSMTNLDEKYSKLNDRLLKIEDGQIGKGIPRRSLVNGGRIGIIAKSVDTNKINPDKE